MTPREYLVAAISQMLAPKLFVLSGDNPAEMGFPFGETEQDVKDRIHRQFDPVSYWTEKATEIAEAIVETVFSGGEVGALDIDAVIAKSAEYAAAWQPGETH